MRTRVSAGARLHFGFTNLSLVHERLYGSLGVGLDEPRVTVAAEPAGEVDCDHPDAAGYARRAAELLGVDGAAVRVKAEFPCHVGLGSGTQLALCTLAAVARAHAKEPKVRERAPALDRGGRSGVGVAAFEAGGFVLDAGHPTERFTAERPARGEWRVPPVTARHDVPERWRFVLVLPDIEPGRNGEDENESMRATVEGADPTVADRISARVTRHVLPAVADDDPGAFGAGVAEVGRLNGTWYADEQGGIYRPPVGAVVDELGADPAVSGAGQSSWGPAVYGVTTAEAADDARAAGERALDAAGVDGRVEIVAARNRGAAFQ